MMSFEKSFFEKKQVNWSSLADFGFVKEDEVWHYCELFFDGSFEAQIQIMPDGQVMGQIVDVELDEPYLAYQVLSPVGAFVHQVRDAYSTILERVAEACFTEQLFRSDQANRLAQRILKEFSDKPDHPFKRIPEAVVFRSPANQKWYALVMSVSRNKVDKKKPASSEVVDILNIKVNEKVLPQLLEKGGFYPSYHMSKTSWLTIILDETVDDNLIFDLLSQSRALVSPKSYRAAENEPDYWIIPANLKLYDIDLDFAQNKEQVWHHKGKINAGDIMGIYITAPTRALRYICRISDVFQENDEMMMRLHLVKVFPDNEFPIDRLIQLGVKAVRGPRRMTPDLVAEVKAIL
ncbi:MmcQ/YjbR family DNA-binding protein [Streptococcus merionis]|nr:MmcQ/YjbR family DNA-binding protein [Streptococcus merionis]